MNALSSLLFPPFRLELDNAQLWREGRAVPLWRKTFAVLRYLVEQQGQLVTKEQLFKAVWAGAYVEEVAVAICIRELRKALGDDTRTPRFIETVHGRGYRFLPAVTTPQPVPSSRFQVPSSDTQHSVLSTQHSVLVGRESELALLHTYWENALRGERQIVFVTGEPGIGKTTVVETFLSQIAPLGKIWIGRGQCVEQYGAGEAYMPILEALGRLCREPEGERLIALLHHYAPTWVVQMPAVLNPAELETLQRTTQHATRERMLRELAEAVAALTVEQPLVLRLEDLHWSDSSTLELLSVLARWQEPARLFVLGTYRPVEMLQHGNPLRAVTQELQLHKQCEELRLGLLTANEVAAYVSGRLAEEVTDRKTRDTLAHAIHQRTEGNPLFMVTVVEDLRAQKTLGDIRAELRGVPSTIQQMIERQLDRLRPEEQRVLEVASVAGVQFSATAVAAGTQMTTGDVEACCSRLARREQFLRTNGVSEWPDGTVATHYSFLHALYRDVLYERTPIGHRVALHCQIGAREEQAYGDQARAIAAELAVHFERGRDYRKAIKYLQQAGENALQRSAHQEAIILLTRGLELLTTLPDTHERTQQELMLHIVLGGPLIATKGYAALEVETIYARARELCQQVGETPQLVPALGGLWQFYLNRAEYQTGSELGEQLLALAQNVQDPILLVVAHDALGQASYCLGEFVQARSHLEQVISLYDLQQHHSLASLCGGEDPGVVCRGFAAWTLWLLGYPDKAFKRTYESLSLARELSSPFNLALALGCAALLHQFRRERQATQEQAEAAMTLSSEQGFALFLALGTIMQGWALAEEEQREEGIAQMRQGLTAFRATGEEFMQPYFLALLAEAHGKMEQVEEGLMMLTEALDRVNKTGERFYEAELYRLKGELTLQKQSKVTSHKSKVPSSQEAEAYFQKAIEIARKQQAKSLELRATMSLARLWQRQGKKDEARQLLAEIYGWFTEGFDTKDLQEAKRLLEKLR